MPTIPAALVLPFRRALVPALVLFLAASPLSAQTIDFTGAFDLSNWTFTSGGTPSQVSLNGSTSFTISGSNDNSGANTFTTFVVTLPASYRVSFDWAYSTVDTPFYDSAGQAGQAGALFQLSDGSGAQAQSGSVTGAYFASGSGFYINSFDNQYGAANLTISNFSFTLADSSDTGANESGAGGGSGGGDGGGGGGGGGVATGEAHWTGANNSSWHNAANWDTSSVPTEQDNVFINNGTSVVTTTGAKAFDVHVGDTSPASLTVQGGGTGSSVTLAVGTDSHFTVTGAGSSWAVGGTLGAQGTNSSIAVSNGGALTAGDTYVDYGGRLTVTGAGSSLDTSAGGLGLYTGTVLVDDHATVNAGGLYVAYAGGNVATVTVSNGAHVDAAGIQVGGGGTGVLNIQSGGTVTSTGYVDIGEGDGTVNVTGSGSRLDISNTAPTFYIGSGNDGHMTISSGGVVTSGQTVLGYAGSGKGDVLVTGTGSLWEINTNATGTALEIGSNPRNSVVTITDGAQVNLTGSNKTVNVFGLGTLNIGTGGLAGSLSASKVTVGNASLNFNFTNNLEFGATLNLLGGTINKDGAGRLTLTGSMQNNSTDNFINLNGGSLQIGNGGTTGTLTNDVESQAGTTLIFNRSNNLTWGFSLHGAGALVQAGTGTLTVGGTSNAFTGGTTVNAGTLRLQSASALGTVSSGVTLAGGSLQIANNSSTTFNGTALTVTADATLGVDRTSASGGTASPTHTIGALSIGSNTLTVGLGTSGNFGTNNVANLVTGAVTLTGNATFNLTNTKGSGVGTTTLGALNDGGVGRTITKSGAATLNLGTAATSLVNGTAFNVTAGTVNLNQSAALGSLASVTLSSGATFALGSGVTPTFGALNGTGGTLTLGANTLTIGNANNLSSSFGGVLSGTNGALAKAGTGTLTLTGANTFTGGTTISAGTLNANKIAVSSGNSSLGNATSAVALGGASTAGTLSYTGNTGNYTRGLTVNAGGGGFDVATAGQTVTFTTGGVATSGLFSVGGAGNTTINTVVSGGGGLAKNGAGTLTLAGVNTQNGGTTVNAGTLTLTGSGTLGAATNALALNGGTLDLGGLSRSAGTTTFAGGTLSNGTLTGSAYDARSGSVGAILAGSGALTKTTAGTFTVSGANTYTGGTAVNGGTLAIASDNNLGGAGAISFAGGTLATSASFTSGRTTTLNAGGGTFDTAAGTTLTWDGNIGGTGSLTKAGAGTLLLGGSNSYSGTTFVTTGTLRLNSAGALSANTTLNVANGATFDANGYNQTFSGLGGTGSVSTGSTGITVQTQAAAPSTFAGALSGSGALTVNGGGTLTLTGNSAATFTGTTSVSNATLVVNGSLGSNPVTIGAGGTIGGHGTVGNLTLASGSFLSPGNSPGNLSTGSVTMDGGSTYVWEINNATPGGAGVTWDLVSVTGTLTVTANSGNPFAIDIVSLNAGNAAGLAANFNQAQNATFVIASTTAGISGFDVSDFTIDTSAFQNPFTGAWTVALGNAGHDLNLVYTAASAIPEPSAYAALLGLGTLSLVIARRRLAARSPTGRKPAPAAA